MTPMFSISKCLTTTALSTRDSVLGARTQALNEREKDELAFLAMGLAFNGR